MATITFPKPKLLLGIILAIILSIILLFFWLIDAKATVGFENCREAKDAGHVNIVKTDKYYRSALDRNSNDIACEE